MSFLGYSVEKTELKNVPYVLHGPRGARHRLMRAEDGLLFPMNKNGKLIDISGHTLFTDESGELRVAGA